MSKWDVSNVKDMSYAFNYCINFKGKGIENWDVRNVTNMSGMFYDCRKFNCDLNSWDVSNVTKMYDMFNNCTVLKNKPSWYNGNT